MTDERERNMDKRRKKENKWERIESCKDKNVMKMFPMRLLSFSVILKYIIDCVCFISF